MYSFNYKALQVYQNFELLFISVLRCLSQRRALIAVLSAYLENRKQHLVSEIYFTMKMCKHWKMRFKKKPNKSEFVKYQS